MWPVMSSAPLPPWKNRHIVMLPWLAFGHLIPYLDLAKLIALKGHKISFISTPRNIQRLPKLPPNLQHLVELVEIPLPHVDKIPENAEATADVPHHIVPYLKKAFDGLEEPLVKFLERSTPDWVIHDFVPYWLPPLSSKLGILCIALGIFSAFGSAFYAGRSLALEGANETSFDESPNKVALQPFEDKNISDDHMHQNEYGVSDLFRIQATIHGAHVLATRSCREIEGEFLTKLENLCRKQVIPIGLLPPSLQFSEDNKDDNWDAILNWLNRQEKRSMVYIAFGSEVTLNTEDFVELALGLELSGLPFFWTLRKQSVPARIETVELQDWLQHHSSERGLVWTTWVPQSRILAHNSVGGFLTHCGWSSVIESLQVGCPLIMLPLKNEQGLIARLMEDKKVGIKVPRSEQDGKFTRDSIAKSLRSMILADEGKACRSQAEEMSKIFGDRELHQKYVDEFIEYLEIHRPATLG